MITIHSTHIKICLINLYFGEWPKWFPLFLKCCKRNHKIDFLLFSDQELESDWAENIKHRKISLSDFNQLASQKLNILINIKKPYKVCDFKPFYGKIFEDYLIDYSYWGYCDNDIVFANISDFITSEMLHEYDIINTYRGFLSGPFCLFKNKSQINFLYEKIFRYQEILLEEKYVGIDENVQRHNLKGITFKKLMYFIPFLLKDLFNNNNTIANLPEIRYQFQWHFKIRMIKDKVPIDMTEVIWANINKLGISIFSQELLLSEYYFKRKRLSNWQIKCHDNELNLLPGNKKIFGFHFRGSLLNWDFIFDEIQSDTPFKITKDGVFNISK